MKPNLKPLTDQIIVITGASSGIGLVTARMASKRGARLVLAARAGEALRELRDELSDAGGEAVHVTADVGKAEDVRNIARTAHQAFGGFDTWVNNAGISIYGKLTEVALEDMRQLFETNFWGMVHGSLEAARHLQERGGALINIGSTLSDRAIPLQGAYCASKHAVKGFTDALRMELEADGAPVSVTLIKPSGIDTPYSRHAKNYLSVEPQNSPPIYAPEAVAEAILHCAEHPERDVFVGAGGKGMSAFGYHAPRLLDRVMEKMMIRQQKTEHPPNAQAHRGLNEPSGELAERGGYEGHVAQSSLYTRASLHRGVAGSVLLGAGLAAAALWRATHNGKRNRAWRRR